jgi:hypothetical protein
MGEKDMRRALSLGIMGMGLALAFEAPASAAILIPTASPTVQPFSIGTTATASLPTDWRVDRNDTTARTIGSYSTALTATQGAAGGAAAVSSSATGQIYNYGASADTNDRAVGFLSSSTNVKTGNLYVALVAGGSDLNALQLSYNVEKYRNGSNAAGFIVQMYYSTDGAAWTSAGSSFLTTIAADADNNGSTTNPQSTVAVSNTLSVNIPASSNFFLGWSYSVGSGTTTSNGQGLGIDDVSIQGVPAPEPGSVGLLLSGAFMLITRRRRLPAL